MWPHNYTSSSKSGSNSSSEEDSLSDQKEDSDECSTPEEEQLDDVAKLKYWSRHHYMCYWPLLLPDHVHVSYLLCPLPKVIEHAKNPANCDPEDQQACERLLKKLMVPVEVVDRAEREVLEAQLIDTFLSELHDFQNCKGPSASSHPWIIAQNMKMPLPMSGMRSIDWVKLRSWMPLPAGSHLKLRLLVVYNIIGRQQRGTRSAREGN